jgi:hypothetical protein
LRGTLRVVTDASTLGWFTLGAALGGALLAGVVNLALRLMDHRAERRRRADESAARVAERRAADLAEVRREGASAVARASSWLVEAQPDRLVIITNPDGWGETVRSLRNRLAELDEPLGVLAVRLPSREGRDLAAEFGAALSRMLTRDAWLLHLIGRDKQFDEIYPQAMQEWENAYKLAQRLREAMHESEAQ